MPNYQHDPIINYSANLLKQAGTEQYTTGRETQKQGQTLTDKGVGDLQPVYDYFKKLLSGDMTELMSAVQPEADVIGQQFDQVRRMLSDQPRGGGKTSASASLPIEQIRMMSNLLAGARSRGAQGASDTASRLIGAGETRSSLGLGQVVQGLGASEASGSIAMTGRNTDIANSWKTFFKDMAKGAVEGGGAALVSHFL